MGKNKKIVLYKDLIVDVSDFRHPGYNDIIYQFQGKNMAQAYTARGHSLNSDLIVCHRTIGKLQNCADSKEGKSFYESIRNNKMFQQHESIVAKFDFSAPLMDSIQKLKVNELQLLTDIPKYFS